MMKVSPIRLSSSPSSVRMSGALLYRLVTCMQQQQPSGNVAPVWPVQLCATAARLLLHGANSAQHAELHSSNHMPLYNSALFKAKSTPVGQLVYSAAGPRQVQAGAVGVDVLARAVMRMACAGPVDAYELCMRTLSTCS